MAQFGTRDLVYTLPFVLAGMGRYLYLVYRHEKGGKPHEILLNDWLLQIIILGWIGWPSESSAFSPDRSTRCVLGTAQRSESSGRESAR